MTAIVIDKGMLDALDKQLKWYRLERAELRDKCARLERENAGLKQEYTLICGVLSDAGFPDDGDMIGSIRMLYERCKAAEKWNLHEWLSAVEPPSPVEGG